MAPIRNTRSDATLHLVPGGLTGRRELSARQEQLLDELEALVLREGFTHLTVASLAAQLRCSRTTLYDVADTKLELVLLALDRMFYRAGETAQKAASAQGTNLGRLREFLLRGLGEIRAMTVTFLEDAATEPDVQALVTSRFHEAAKIIESIIKDGQRAGEFTDVNATLIAEVLRAGAESLLNPTVLRASKTTYMQALEEFLSFAARGLAPNA